jgi:hypothetical protein
MKTKLFKLTAILLLIPLLNFANDNRHKYEKTKKINKEFNVNENALLKINNRYGNVDISTWDENRIVFEIEITVSGNSEDHVIDKLEEIDVSFNANSHEVYAKTLINKNRSKSWFSWGNFSRHNINFKINYKVKMPKSNDLNVNNDYGSIYLNELDGKASINCDYGKIVIGTLNHKDNYINTDYSKNSTIEYINGGKINADYSSFTVEAAKNIDLNADYTSSHFENIETLDFNCDYGSLYVDKANNIEGDGDYLSMKFGKIYKNIILDADYGSIRIAELQNDFEKVEIDSDYTGIKIGVDPKSDFNITTKLSYAGFNYNDGHFTFNKKNVKSTSKYYEGYHNNKNNNSIITIDTDYGSVKLFDY